MHFLFLQIRAVASAISFLALLTTVYTLILPQLVWVVDHWSIWAGNFLSLIELDSLPIEYQLSSVFSVTFLVSMFLGLLLLPEERKIHYNKGFTAGAIIAAILFLIGLIVTGFKLIGGIIVVAGAAYIGSFFVSRTFTISFTFWVALGVILDRAYRFIGPFNLPNVG